MTLCVMPFSILTLSIKGLFKTLGMTLGKNDTQNNNTVIMLIIAFYLFVILSVFMLNVVMLSVIMMSVILLNVVESYRNFRKLRP